MQDVILKYKEWFQLERVLLCELSSVLFSSLLIAEILEENFALPAEGSVSLMSVSSAGSEGESSRSMRSSGPMKLCGRGAVLRN